MNIEREGAIEPQEQEASIVRMWRKNHQIFKGKFSSGATPKTNKETVKITNTQKKARVLFSNEGSTPRRRNLCNLIKTQILNGPPTLKKDISNIQQVEQEVTQNDRQEIYTTPPKKTSNSNLDRSIKQSYEEQKHRLKEYDEENSRFDADYEEMCTLGSGCFGVVKKCRNRVDGGVYAIKIMRPIQKNLNQVKALASLSNIECTNIVRYHNSWVQNSRLFMVMEYCQSNLKTIILNCKREGIIFPQKIIRQVAKDILHALENLHKNNIVHLDIKPQNILLSFAGHYKLGDLGLCRIAQLKEGEDVSEGDSRYLAKEVLSKMEDHLPDLTKADVFSLGMTLFEMVTMEELPNTGPYWHNLRDGGVAFKLQTLETIYSPRLLQIIINMVDGSFWNRMSAEMILQRPYFYSPDRAMTPLSENSQPPLVRRLSA